MDADRLASPGVVLLDARDAARYRGDVEPVDPRAGHVPGARSLPARETLDADGRLLPVEELRGRFAAAGVTPGGDVVAMCGSGVTACHTLLALEHAGLGRRAALRRVLVAVELRSPPPGGHRRPALSLPLGHAQRAASFATVFQLRTVVCVTPLAACSRWAIAGESIRPFGHHT